MSNNKTDRASLRRQAQRKESYAELISKRKYMLNSIVPHKKRRLSTLKNVDVSNICNQEYEEKEKETVSRTCVAKRSAERCQDFLSGVASKSKLVYSTTVKSELDISSVMTRSATRKYTSVGALHNKVDWEQQLKITKRWPVDVAYTIEGPIVQNTELRNVLSNSLTEVMSFCKNVWSVNNKVKMADEDGEVWLLSEAHDYFDLASYSKGETEENENDDNSLNQQIVNVYSINDDDQQDIFFIQQENEEFETVTLNADETYVVDEDYADSSYFDQNGTAMIKDNVYQCDPMIAVRHDHNYALKCDVMPIKTPKVENLNIINKEEEEFKLENALNNLLLNTAILKCLVCGESPQGLISTLESAQL